MNSSLEPPRTVVFALCGSFCTFETVLPQIIRLRACGWEVLPMLSYAASALDTRFGRAADWKQRLEEATGHRPLEDLREAEPLGPKHMAQALVIAPCTGTTMALLAAGIMGHIAIQVILNIAVVTNSIPNTGITLPFVSYGGTSVCFLLAEMGIALSVSARTKL